MATLGHNELTPMGIHSQCKLCSETEEQCILCITLQCCLELYCIVLKTKHDTDMAWNTHGEESSQHLRYETKFGDVILYNLVP